MKTLTTDQQVELKGLVDYLGTFEVIPIDTLAQLRYWSIELKPKRVRRNPLDNQVEG